MTGLAKQDWRPVIEAWFPSGLAEAGAETHHWMFGQWFGGGQVLPAAFAPLAEAALRGQLDEWAAAPLGRLALILLLDQAPRQFRAGTPEAYAGDADALRIAEDGLRNGQYDALAHPWERTFFFLPLAHAEGPDHRERMIRVVAMAEAVAWSAPEPLLPLYRFSAEQARGHQAVIARFGRYPHRNALLGRASTPEERGYLATGDLVHLRRPPQPVAYPTTA
ncbi:DUF924 family protein [Paracraurococcus lichenis]|uniref:DUF924 family protein n=1 Tax=Paracraurococcus lichenis TaxID=3064888 RepID=A0ABT9DZS3_9PROT|nr:DUF924 family protein [Paracraurococcus sp. LOR1-02]MDO9709408.1 DUF924 family protein [Paracraurococcus sp. LOR1-02]